MSGFIVLALRLLMAAAVYIFLGWALWTIWLDLRQEAQGALAHRFPAIRLEIRTGTAFSHPGHFPNPKSFLDGIPNVIFQSTMDPLRLSICQLLSSQPMVG